MTQEGRVQGSVFRSDFTARTVAHLGCGYLVEQRPNFPAFSLLTLIFPFRRHKAAGDGRPPGTAGRRSQEERLMSTKNRYVRNHRELTARLTEG
jgi:hypothetical protein